MSGYIVVLVFGFLLGFILGGPSTESLEEARLEGYLEGLNPKIVPCENKHDADFGHHD